MLSVTPIDRSNAVEDAKQLAIKLQLALDAVKFAIEHTEYNYLIDTRMYEIKRLVEGCR